MHFPNLVFIILHLIVPVIYGNTNTTLYFEIGETAVLTCPYKSQNFSTQWRGPNGLRLYSQGWLVQKSLPHYHRISISGDQDVGEFDLHIENFSDFDEGFYRCISTENGAIVHSGVKVRKFRKPSNISIVNSTINDTVVVSEGQNSTLTCMVDSGTPLETMMWIIDDKCLIKGGPGILNLQFVPTQYHHLKYFVCSVSNSEKYEPITRRVKLFVVTIPVVHIHNSRIVNITEGDTISLICTANSNIRTRKIAWSKADSNLSSLTVTNVKSIKNLTYAFTELTIRNISRDFTGFVNCRANNIAGDSMDTVYLFVKYKPKIFWNSSSLEFGTEVGIVANISIMVESFEKPEVSWLSTLGGKQGSWKIDNSTDESGSYGVYHLFSTIVPLKHKHFGNYSLIIRNSVGKTVNMIAIVYADWHVMFNSSNAKLNTSDSSTLACLINPRNYTNWTVTIKHFWNGYLIRSLPVKLKFNMAILDLKYVDYTDTGEYICTMTTKGTTFKASSFIFIRGPPIITDIEMTVAGDYLSMYVKMYAYSAVYDVMWLENQGDKEHIFDIQRHNAVNTTEDDTVYITSYDVRIPVDGVVIILVIPAISRYKGAVFSCRVRNTHGVAERTIDASSVIQKALADKKRKGINESTKLLAAALGGGCFVVILICVACLMKKRRCQSQDLRDNDGTHSTFEGRDIESDQSNVVHLQVISQIQSENYEEVESHVNDTKLENASDSEFSDREYFQIYEKYEDLHSSVQIIPNEYMKLDKHDTPHREQLRPIKSLGDIKSDGKGHINGGIDKTLSKSF